MQQFIEIQTLYKRTKLGKIQKWSIEYSDDGSFRTVEGEQDGKLTTGKPTVCEGKNIGRSNETTPQEQALKEIEAKITKKKDEGYTEDIQKVDEAKKALIKPQLAFEFKEHIKHLQGKQIASQPKLDGMRLLVNSDGDWSRGGKPVISAPHLREEAELLMMLLGENVTLDGEIYNHDLKEDFNKIISLAKKSKPKPEDLVESEKMLQYHIYDVQFHNEPDLDFRKRTAALVVIFLKQEFKYLKLVKTTFVNTLEDLDPIYGEYLEQGYEGQMIRCVQSSYQNNRTKDLLKRKEFVTEEFEIIDVKEGVGQRSGMMGGIVVKKKDGTIFNSNCKGDETYYRELLQNKHKYIGLSATVKYQNLTPDGVPRFPVIIDIGREKYE